MAQMVKNLPAMQETWVWFLDQEDLLENKPKQWIKKQRHHFVNKVLYSQVYGFSSSHVQMWELEHREAWELKNWCFQAVVLEKTLRVPSILKEINPEYSLEVLMLKLKLQYFGHLMWRTDSLEKTPRSGGEGGDRGWDGWHHWPNEHEHEQTRGDGEGHGSLVCYSPWGC